jgi:hypothetical protein
MIDFDTSSSTTLVRVGEFPLSERLVTGRGSHDDRAS